MKCIIQTLFVGQDAFQKIDRIRIEFHVKQRHNDPSISAFVLINRIILNSNMTFHYAAVLLHEASGFSREGK
jgi:hypothetical protein